MILPSAIFAVLAALLLWSIIAGRGWWPAKLAAILAVGVFAFLLAGSVPSFSGWPTKQAPPAHSQFVQGVVIEPDQLTGQKGAIYVWLLPPSSTGGNPFSYRPHFGEPRAFELPYSRQLHEEVQRANQAVAHGKTVEFGTSPPAVATGHGRKGTGNGKRSGGGASHGGRYHAYVLPPVTLSPKEQQP